MSADTLPRAALASTTPLTPATIQLSISHPDLEADEITALLGVEASEQAAGMWAWTLEGARPPGELLTELMSALPGPASPLWAELNTRYTVKLTISTPVGQAFSVGTTLLTEVARMTRRIHFETTPS